jgi:hypothetical protein
MITVRAVGVDDWATWRELRLAALADAPHAFTASIDQWRDTDERRWRDRLAVGHNVVAELDADIWRPYREVHAAGDTEAS